MVHMNAMLTILSRSLANKHTSSAALVYFLAKGAAQFGPIWFPTHAQQFKDSLPVIEGLAVSYGLLMAGDAKQSAAAPTEDKSAMPPLKDAQPVTPIKSP